MILSLFKTYTVNIKSHESEKILSVSSFFIGVESVAGGGCGQCAGENQAIEFTIYAFSKICNGAIPIEVAQWEFNDLFSTKIKNIECDEKVF